MVGTPCFLRQLLCRFSALSCMRAWQALSGNSIESPCLYGYGFVISYNALFDQYITYKNVIQYLPL